MKKKLFLIVAVLFVTLITTLGFNLNTSDVNLTDLASNNTEALAYDSTCPNGCLDSRGSCNCRGEQPFKEANWGDDDRDPDE